MASGTRPENWVYMSHSASKYRAPRTTLAFATGLAAAATLFIFAALGHTPAAARRGPADLHFHAHLPLVARIIDLNDLPRPVAISMTPTSTSAPTINATSTVEPTPTFPPTPTIPPTPTAAPCKALPDRLTIVTTTLAAPLRANDEYFPIPVAPKSDGGSLVAWRDQTALTIHVATFDAQDKLVGTLLSFAGEEVHALVAHEDGGAMVVVENDPDIYSPKYCRGASTPDKSYCAKLDLWRFDGRGKTSWRTTVTGKTNVDKDGAQFIWWYQHTARLVWTGSEYGLYYRSAGSSPRPGVAGEIDIHAGDSFKFLDGSGNVLKDKWTWGCSHSWAVRLAFNGHFGSACHGDGYPNAFHFVATDREQRLGESTVQDNLDPTKRALGGLVPAQGGFWISYMAQVTTTMQLHLAFFDNAGKVTKDATLAAAKNLENQYPFRAYLAEYGTDQMLAGWMSSGTLQLAVFDRTSGKLVEGPVGVKAKIDKWVEFVPYPNGDVGWAWSAGGVNKLDMVRVASCAR